MPTGLTADYTGSPLMGYGEPAGLSFTGGAPSISAITSQPSTGLSAESFGLAIPESGGAQGGLSEAGAEGLGAGLGAAASIASTAIQAATQSNANEDARRTARELAEMRRADEWAQFREVGRFEEAGIGLRRRGLGLAEKEADLATKHNRFMRAFRKGVERNVKAHDLMDNIGNLVYRNSNMRKKLIRGWAST